MRRSTVQTSIVDEATQVLRGNASKFVTQLFPRREIYTLSNFNIQHSSFVLLQDVQYRSIMISKLDEGCLKVHRIVLFRFFKH